MVLNVTKVALFSIGFVVTASGAKETWRIYREVKDKETWTGPNTILDSVVFGLIGVIIFSASFLV